MPSLEAVVDGSLPGFRGQPAYVCDQVSSRCSSKSPLLVVTSSPKRSLDIGITSTVRSRARNDTTRSRNEKAEFSQTLVHASNSPVIDQLDYG